MHSRFSNSLANQAEINQMYTVCQFFGE